jgi:anthranilate synthase component 1
MPHSPDASRFAQLASPGVLIPVYRRLLSDSLTPVSAFHRLGDTGTAALFESVVGGEKVGRYSFVLVGPFLHITAYQNRVVITEGGETTETTCDDPLDFLRRQIQRFRTIHPHDPHLPPFVGGAVGYAGYDVVRYTEHLPNPPSDDRHLPDLSFAFYDQVIVFDNITKTMMIVALARLDQQPDPQDAYRTACQRIDRLVEQLGDTRRVLPLADICPQGEVQLTFESNFQQAQFEKAVRKCVEYIRAGDIFQVVISQRLVVPLRCDPLEIYRTLRVVNPSPFMFFMRTDQVTLVGSSPEIMCRVMDGQVTVRPLAGTRPRGQNEKEDRLLAEQLLADPKERAEHVMLVDLGRNDVGRIARFGTVELSDVMSVERYSHVMHITSNVTGQLAPGLDAFDALRACLPAGTVSGAPKVRAMEIIDQLEPHRRGPYAGAVGYIDYGGNMDTCIALRTLVLHGDKAYIQAGAGIVADSQPAAEYQETLNKARGLLRALEITEARRALRSDTPDRSSSPGPNSG